MTTACQLVYAAAGQPERDDFIAIEGPCWWCACPSPTGRGWPLSRLSDMFQGAEYARCPSSAVICAACAWTLGVGFRLPRHVAEARLAKKADEGRRIDLDGDHHQLVRDGKGWEGKFLALRLADGRVGLWTTASGGKEAPWVAARTELEQAPRDVGPCRYLGAHHLSDLVPGVERFVQAFHHIVVDGVWTACTDADKPTLRAHLLRDDLRGPVVTSLALAQGKHTLIHTPVEYPELGTRTVYALGQVDYRPAELRQLLHAVEALRRAGASREEIDAGEYHGHGVGWLPVMRAYEPVAATARGGLLFDLAMHLCRPAEELREAPDLGAEPTTPSTSEIGHAPQAIPTPTRTDRPIAPEPVGSPAAPRTGAAPADRPPRPAGWDGRQSRLF